jgi:hypothetical protein
MSRILVNIYHLSEVVLRLPASEDVSTTILRNIDKYLKAIPLQYWTGPEGSRRLRLPDFKTIGT